MDRIRPSQPQKRRRQIFSCNECRRRKLKCDRTTPCNRCVKSGCPEVCSYKSHNHPPLGETSVEVEDDRNDFIPPHSIENRPQEAPRIVEAGQLTPSSSDFRLFKDRDTTISDLQKRVMMLESLLRERTYQSSHASLHDGISIRSDGGSPECWPNQAGLRNVHFLKDFLHGKNDRTSFHGRSHWYALCGQFDDLISMLDSWRGYKDRESAREYRSMKRLCSQVRENKNYHMQEHQSMILHAYIPPREIADQLVNFYLDTFEYTYRILHVPTFRKEYNEFWVTPARENFHFMAKLYSILAISASHDFPMQNIPSELSLKDQVPIWLHCVQHWLDHAIENSKHIFDSLQVHCLLTIARQVTSMDSNMVWISCGALVRTAISAGLHRNPNSFRLMTPFHAEMRRRLWATILELELQSSLEAGKQPFISCGDFDCDMPSNFDDEDITNPNQILPNPKPPDVFTRTSCLIALSKSLPARLEVVKLANGLTTNISYNDLLRLSAQITRSFQDMPRPHYKMDPGVTTMPYPTFPTAFFDFLTRRFLLVIHRQVAIMGAYDSKYHFSRTTCLDSSLTMLSYFGISLSSGEGDSSRRTQLAACCGGMFRNELSSAILSICAEMLMGKVDTEVLGCSIHDRPLSAITSPGNRFRMDHLMIIIEKALKIVEQWILEGHAECSKMYLCLYAVFSSVKARYANEDPQTAVATALSESIENCKMLLLQKASGIQIFDGGVAQNDTPDSNISAADDAGACNAMQVGRCLMQSTFTGDMVREDSEWDNADSWEIDWEF